MEINKKILGNKIKEIRVNKRMTLEEFANTIREKTDNTQRTGKSNVSKWERGENIPNDITLKAIADIAGISVDELLIKYSKKEIESEIIKTAEDFKAPFLGAITKLLPLGKMLDSNGQVNQEALTATLNAINSVPNDDYTMIEIITIYLRNCRRMDVYDFESLYKYHLNTYRDMKLIFKTDGVEDTIKEDVDVYSSFVGRLVLTKKHLIAMGYKEE